MSNFGMLDTNLTMALAFLLALAGLVGVMKLAALLRSAPAGGTWWLFVLSPLPAPTSLNRAKPMSHARRLLLRMMAATGGLLLWYPVTWSWLNRIELNWALRSYLGIPGLLLWAEVFGCWVGWFWSWSGRLLPGPQNEPWRAKGIADFWGRRWNVWFSDWFRLVIFTPLRHRSVLGVMTAFAASGLMHEWVVNVPLYLVTGRKQFGSMLAYFLLQAAGLLFERRVFPKRSRARTWLAWLVVVLPAPLVVNEGLLRALLLWPR